MRDHGIPHRLQLRFDRGEIDIDLGIAYGDVLVYFTLAQSLHDDFVAHVLAVLGKWDVVLGQLLAQAVES